MVAVASRNGKAFRLLCSRETKILNVLTANTLRSSPFGRCQVLPFYIFGPSSKSCPARDLSNKHSRLLAIGFVCTDQGYVCGCQRGQGSGTEKNWEKLSFLREESSLPRSRKTPVTSPYNPHPGHLPVVWTASTWNTRKALKNPADQLS